MPSAIFGVSRALTWKDYKVTKKPVPPDDTTVDVASTFATRSMPGGWNIIGDKSAKPVTYKLQDAITVNVGIDSAKSWVADWIFSKWSQSKQDAILDHEQGHYNIVALLARDYYAELMLMLGKTYTTAAAGTTDGQVIANRFNDAIVQAVQTLYDSPSETDHDPIDNAQAQTKWDGFFADAVSKNKPLLTILSDAGLTVPTQPKSPL